MGAEYASVPSVYFSATAQSVDETAHETRLQTPILYSPFDLSTWYGIFVEGGTGATSDIVPLLDRVLGG